MDPDDERCEDIGCAERIACFVCETCAAHCALKDPEECLAAHEAWRTGQRDPAFVGPVASVTKPGRVPLFDGKSIPATRPPRRVS